LPSGVLRPSKLAVIGNGMVFDPQAFLDEAAKLQKQASPSACRRNNEVYSAASYGGKEPSTETPDN
jgi:adenylosuccinate synthase